MCVVVYNPKWQFYNQTLPNNNIQIFLRVLYSLNVIVYSWQVRRCYYSEGPSYVWHLDGYDKLKPYGFPIHGCIDGFSRKILWLEVFNVICQCMFHDNSGYSSEFNTHKNRKINCYTPTNGQISESSVKWIHYCICYGFLHILDKERDDNLIFH